MSPCVSRIVDRGFVILAKATPTILIENIYMSSASPRQINFLNVISSNQQNYTQRKNILLNVFDSYYTVTYVFNAFYRLKSGARLRSDVLFMVWFTHITYFENNFFHFFYNFFSIFYMSFREKCTDVDRIHSKSFTFSLRVFCMRLD